MKKLLVVERDLEKYEQRFAVMGLEGLKVVFVNKQEDVMREIVDAEIILANPLMVREFLGLAKGLKWFQSVFAGVDCLMAEGMRRDYLLTNVKDVYGEVMRDYCLGYFLAFERNLFEMKEDQVKEIWNQKACVPVGGKVVGVMGTGSIGKEIALGFKALGCKVVGLRTRRESVEGFEKIFVMEELADFLAICDCVVAVLPSTRSTCGLMNREKFLQMKKGAVFMNVGRGSLVVEEDVAGVMEDGHLRAMVLDVFCEEPLKKGNVLWGVPGVYVSPHVSGYVVSERVFDIFEENFERFVKGEELRYLVNFDKGY